MLINDGFTVSATIPARAPWPAVAITYRPAMPEKVYDWQGVAYANPAPSGKARMEATIKLLTDQLLTWDVRPKPDAETIPCTPDNWRRLPHPTLERIVELVTGYAAPEGDQKNG